MIAPRMAIESIRIRARDHRKIAKHNWRIYEGPISYAGRTRESVFPGDFPALFVPPVCIYQVCRFRLRLILRPQAQLPKFSPTDRGLFNRVLESHGLRHHTITNALKLEVVPDYAWDIRRWKVSRMRSARRRTLNLLSKFET